MADSNPVPPRTRDDAGMDVLLETERLVLRRFTAADVDNLVELDSDPEVMDYITGGRVTSREEIQNEVLPAFLNYYDRFRATASERRLRKQRECSSAGSTCAQRRRWAA